jgi:hypothetical protein
MAFKMKGFTYPGTAPLKDIKEAWAGKMEDGTPEWDHEAYAHNQAEDAYKEGKGPDPHAKGGPTYKSAFKQDKEYTHEDMYDLEEELSYILEDLEEDPENQELLDKKKELEAKIDEIHATLEGGNIKPGYTEGERDKSKDETYPQ